MTDRDAAHPEVALNKITQFFVSLYDRIIAYPGEPSLHSYPHKAVVYKGKRTASNRDKISPFGQSVGLLTGENLEQLTFLICRG
jgi:hypothetical protein